MREKVIQAALVGCGSWGQTLVRSIQGRSDQLRFARLVSRRPERAADFAREVGLQVEADLDAVLLDPAIDAIVLATPHSQHPEQVIAAAGAGKHVFVEKPLALSRRDAEAAVKATQEAGVVLAVGQNRRFLPAYQELKRRLADEEFGRITHIEANFSGPSGYKRTPDSWRVSTNESPAGGMTGKGVHMTDLMIDLLGRPETAHVRSFQQVLEGEMDDHTLALIDFTSGATGLVTTLTATPDIWRFQVFCSRGWFEIRESDTLTIRRLDGDAEVVAFEPVDLERAELEAFAAAVAGRATFPVEPAQAIWNSALLETVAVAADAANPSRRSNLKIVSRPV